MAAITLYATNNLASNSQGQELSATDPGAEAYASPVAGWVVSTGATNNSAFEGQAERAATTFADTGPPDGSLDTTLGDFLRSAITYSGDFASADWNIHFACRANNNGGAQDGRMRCRLFRGANEDGSSATEITAAQQQGGLVSNLATSATQVSTATFNPGAFSVSNEYLFIQLAWERTGAGGMTTSDVNMRIGNGSGTGTRVITSNFTEAALTPGIAPETDTALTAGGVQEKIATGAALETDTALAPNVTSVGVALETDTALAPNTTTVGVALETDTALAPNVTTVGVALEMDAALSPALVERLAVGVAVETDTARAPNVTSVGVAFETDAALAVAIVERIAVGAALETDVALAPNTTTVGVALETDTALAPTLVAGGITPGIALETDTARAPNVTTIGIALETDAALSPGIVERLATGVALETDTARAPNVTTIGIALETDAALAPALVERLTPGVAAETDVAIALTLSERFVVGVALETDAALALAVVERIAVGRANEIDTALSPFGVGINPGVAVEVDTALALVLWQVMPRQGIEPWHAGPAIDPWVASNFPGKWEPYEVE